MSHSGESRSIYLDYRSTTPVAPRVANQTLHYMTTAFGNAGSINHSYGDEAEHAVKQAAKHVAELVVTSPIEIVWTSGATESITWQFRGVCLPTLENLTALRCCHSNTKPFSTPAMFWRNEAGQN